MSVFDWSTTAADNDDADSNINWEEGQAPSTVNDSARAEMARIAHWRNMLGANVTMGGTGNAYTYTTGETLTAYADGIRLLWQPNADPTGAVTINVDTIGAKKVYMPDGTQAGNGSLDADSLYDIVYDASLDSASGAFKIVGFPDTTLTAADYLAAANNLSDVASASTARSNIGAYGSGDNVSFGTITGTGDVAIDTDTLFVDVSESSVGMGTTSPDGKLHVYSGSAGSYSSNANADDLIVENNGNCGISIVAPASNSSQLRFVNPADSIAGALVYSHSSDALGIWANSSERVTIDSSGHVGIGTATVNQRLVVGDDLGSRTSAEAIVIGDASDDASLFIGADSSNYLRIFWDESTAETRFQHREGGTIYNSLTFDGGNVGILTTNPSDVLEVNGDVTAVDFNATSDARLKENIERLPYGLAAVLAMQPRAYDWIEQKEHDIGFVAQELESIVPEVVSQKGEYKRVSYGKLVAVMAKAIQELNAKVEALENGRS